MARTLFFGMLLTSALSVGLAGCGDSTSNPSSTSSSSSSTVSTEPATTITPDSSTTTSGDRTFTSTSVPASDSKRYLVSATAEQQNGRDALRFVFDNGTPGYSIGYVKPPLKDESAGKTVAVNGTYALQITFESSATVNLTGGAKVHFGGPDRFSPAGTATLVEVAKVSEFEGRMTWGAGTRTEQPFRVESSPNALTVLFG